MRFDSQPVRRIESFGSQVFEPCAANDPTLFAYGVYEGAPSDRTLLCCVTDPEDAAQLVARLNTLHDALGDASDFLHVGDSFRRADAADAVTFAMYPELR